MYFLRQTHNITYVTVKTLSLGKAKIYYPMLGLTVCNNYSVK